MWTYGGSKIHREIWFGNLKVRDDLQNLGAEERIILKWILNK
jgi:hypothetical protein